MKVASNFQMKTLSAGNKYYLLLIMLWVVSIAGSAQELPIQSGLLNNQPASQEDPVEQVRFLMNSYLFESDEEIIYRIRNVVNQSGLNELTETAREHLVKANIYLEKQQYKNSIEEYQQLILDSPWVFDAFFNLAHIYAADIQYNKAIETMQNYIILQPQGSRSRQARDAIYKWEVLEEEREVEKMMASSIIPGVLFVDIDADNQKFGTIEGVIITEIDQDSKAWGVGFRKGDIITEVNDKTIRNMQEFLDMANKYINEMYVGWVRGGELQIDSMIHCRHKSRRCGDYWVR